MQEFRILVLDENPALAHGRSLAQILNSPSDSCPQLYSTYMPCEASLDKTFRSVQEFRPDLVFVAVSFNAWEQTESLVRNLAIEPNNLAIIAVSAENDQDRLIKLLKLGVRDFITTPLRPEDVFPRVWRLLNQTTEKGKQSHLLRERFGLKKLVGESPTFLKEIQRIPLVARGDSSVLVMGETGTGKELVARTIHYLSPRFGKPFVPVNCGAIPSELIENEFFGHNRGAYTGADTSQDGLIHEAEGGTIFLDEIDCLPLDIQVKLLRLLQEKEYRCLGSPKVHQADIRVVAASNADLDKLVKGDRFRNDLYYRLNVFQLTLPPLRERKEDIPLLTRHFLPIFAARHSQKRTGLTDRALGKLMFYDWPGNVRELENTIERAVVYSGQEVITGDDITLPGQSESIAHEPFHVCKARVLDDFEKDYIKIMLLVSKGNITKAARAAQKSRRGFWDLIRKHGIDAQRYKDSSI